MRQVHWTAPAEWDLEEIDDYWCGCSVERADEILDVIRESGDFLAGLPKAGPALEEADLRKWRIAGTNYILVYRLIRDGVQILRVRHTSEDWRP
jgi:toxin ParE1/3/4